MINTREDYTPIDNYEQLGADASDVFASSLQSALSDNPTTKLIDYNTLRNYESEAREKKEPLLTKQQAQEEAAAKGLAIQNLPDQISRKGFDFLAERQYQAKKRNDIIERGDSTSASLLGGLVGSFIDPINIASSFIPVGKIGQLASWASKARAPIANIGAKAAIGAIEGVAGAAIIEPLNYGLSQELGDDYTSYNSLMNIGFGAALGAGLHAGVAAAGEGFARLKSTPVSREAAKLQRQIDAMSIEQKEHFLIGALAKGVEDRPINVDLMEQAHKIEVVKEIEKVEMELKQAIAQKDVGAVAYLTKQKEKLADQYDPTLLEEARSKIPTDPNNLTDNAPYLVDRKSLEAGMLESKMEVNEASIVDLAESRIKQSLDDAQTVTVKTAKGDVEIASIKDGVMKDVDGNEHLLKDNIDSGVTISSTELSKNMNPIAHADILSNIKKSTDTSKRDLSIKAKESSTIPDSKYLDQNLLDKQNELLVSNEKLEEFENLKTATQADTQFAQEFAEQNGMDLEGVFERHDQVIKEVDDQAKLFKAMTNCVLSKGA